MLASADALADVESIPTLQACGRVLATNVVSAMQVPPMDNSQMDGYAVRSLDVPAAPTTLRVTPAHRRRSRGCAARARHGCPHLHRRAGAAGRRRDRDAGRLRRERRQGDDQRKAGRRRVGPPGRGGRRGGPDGARGRHAAAAAGPRAGRVGRRRRPHRSSPPAGRGLLHRRRTHDAGRAAAARPHLQLQPLRAARAAGKSRLRGARPRHRAGRPPSARARRSPAPRSAPT